MGSSSLECLMSLLLFKGLTNAGESNLYGLQMASPCKPHQDTEARFFQSDWNKSNQYGSLYALITHNCIYLCMFFSTLNNVHVYCVTYIGQPAMILCRRRPLTFVNISRLGLLSIGLFLEKEYYRFPSGLQWFTFFPCSKYSHP